MAGEIKTGALINGRFEILKHLGEGGFASVYLAKDNQLQREVAIKFLKLALQDEDDVARFKREAKVLGGLSHRNIVLVYAYDILEDSTPFIVMEYLAGQSLRSFLNENGKGDFGFCLNVFKQICQGLSYAHSAKLVHRDLSPNNIQLLGSADNLCVKLIDFGLSRLVMDDMLQSKLTQTGMILGNPPYMSPEQARGDSVGVLSDIYSLGCIFYEAVSGKAAFEADNPINLLFKQQEEYPVEPSLEWTDKSKASQFKSIVLRCLQKDPSKRFQTCDELLAAICADSFSMDNENESIRLGLHPWSAASGTRAPSTVSLKLISMLVTSFAMLLLLIGFQDPCIDLLTQLLTKIETPVVDFPKRVMADQLTGAHKGRFAVRLYDDLIARSSLNKDAKGSRDLEMAAAYAWAEIDKKDLSLKHLARALSLNAKLGGSDDKEFLSESSRFLHRLVDKTSVSEFEVTVYTELLEQMRACRSCSNKALLLEISRLSERTRLFASREYVIPDKTIEIVVRILRSRKILPSKQDIYSLEGFLELSNSKASNENVRAINKYLMDSPHTSLSGRALLASGLIETGNAGIRTKRDSCIALLPDFSDTYERKVTLLFDIADLSEDLGERKVALKYLEQGCRLWKEQGYSEGKIAGFNNAREITLLMRCHKENEALKECQRAVVRMAEDNSKIPDHEIGDELRSVQSKTLAIDDLRTAIEMLRLCSLFKDDRLEGKALSNVVLRIRPVPQDAKAKLLATEYQSRLEQCSIRDPELLKAAKELQKVVK